MITKFILGKKGSMNQAYTENGERIVETHIKTQPCFVVDIKTPESDGYWAVLCAFGNSKNVKKSRDGVSLKAGIKTPLRFFKEIRLDKNPDDMPTIELAEGKKKGLVINGWTLMVGDELKPEELFAQNDEIDVTGTSKGKGFQGVVKRHGFGGGPRTHGQSDRERAPGSIGMSATPGRVLKGKKMAGRMGSDTITVQNLHVQRVEGSDMFIRGIVPGPIGGFVIIRSNAAVPEKVEEVVEPEESEKPVVETEAPKVEENKAETVAEVSVEEKVEEVKKD